MNSLGFVSKVVSLLYVLKYIEGLGQNGKFTF